jgi:hypothetical protein
VEVLETGLKAHYGVLKGGGVLRTLRIAASLWNSPAAANSLVTRMMFDPELAQHLLTREVRDVGSPAWNKRLGLLLNVANTGREINGEPE